MEFPGYPSPLVREQFVKAEKRLFMLDIGGVVRDSSLHLHMAELKAMKSVGLPERFIEWFKSQEPKELWRLMAVIHLLVVRKNPFPFLEGRKLLHFMAYPFVVYGLWEAKASPKLVVEAENPVEELSSYLPKNWGAWG